MSNEKNQRLIELREKAGLTQEQLAEAVGLDQSTISNIELGRRNGNATNKARLARFFNVTVDWLFYDQKYCDMA